MAPEVAVRANDLTKTYGEDETEVHALKDVSFESPRSPEIFMRQGEPKIDVQIRVEHNQLTEDGNFHEVSLQVTVTAAMEMESGSDETEADVEAEAVMLVEVAVYTFA